MTLRLSKIDNPRVAEAFAQFPPDIRPALMRLRRLIVLTARSCENVGELTESLKWGQPSYAPARKAIGTPVRIGWPSSSEQHYALMFHCSTKLVDTFRELYREGLEFSGNRAIVLRAGETLPEPALTRCITLALTYHRIKHLPMLGE